MIFINKKNYVIIIKIFLSFIVKEAFNKKHLQLSNLKPQLLNKLNELIYFNTIINDLIKKITNSKKDLERNIRKQFTFLSEKIKDIEGKKNAVLSFEINQLQTQSNSIQDIINYVNDMTNSNNNDVINFLLQYKKIDENINKFINKTRFLEKYDYLKNIFEEIIIKNKYIEEKKVINRINDYINLNLVPLTNDSNLFIQNKKNYIGNISELTIFKEIFEKKNDTYKYEPIITKSFPFIINKGPILIDNSNKKDKTISFFCLSDNSIIKMMIINEYNKEDSCQKENIIINMINVDNIRALVSLTENKNIIFNIQGKILLYNDLFKENKIIGKTPRTFNIVDNTLKISENAYVYTLKNDQKINTIIYYMEIIDNEDESLIETKEIKTNGLTPMPLFYLKDKKILLSLCYKYKYNNIKENNYYCICLINFKTEYPEIFQIININYYEITKKILYFNCFNDESFYFPISQQTYKNEMFYNVIYISQYKFIKGELIEVSKIKKEDDLSLKRYNSYGN
jgi:hypothetical protein